ncbi:HAAS signaling domain-containing protein [Nocardiopsis ansamitocini]|uniref:Uncharacterized protein n=1 Tax=Nocardiopsis ansamitocini TaxID=1670832 RepID=A0A9W6UKU9_9ACTN|nr:hypothetical protein [Nocardiopsis ansamitocini]GLU50102.1 hypothetical protein Nans01_44530 [Nocardiopsis ansamitocini]
MEQTDNAHVQRYLQRLRDASTDLPAGTRNELLDNVRTHLAETTTGADEVQIRNALDELGTPEEIAAAARTETNPRTPGERLYDIATVLTLLAGGFVAPFLGWIAGVVLLWNGPRWNVTQKIIGTLAWPATATLTLGTVVTLNFVNHPAVFLMAVLAMIILIAVCVHLLVAAARTRN